MKSWPFVLLLLLVVISCNKPNYEKNVSLTGTKVFSVFIDNDNIKWFGTEKGVYWYDDTKWLIYTKKDDLPGIIILKQLKSMPKS